MSAYYITPLAKADIFEIWDYIFGDNEAAADSGKRNARRILKDRLQ